MSFQPCPAGGCRALAAAVHPGTRGGCGVFLWSRSTRGIGLGDDGEDLWLARPAACECRDGEVRQRRFELGSRRVLRAAAAKGRATAEGRCELSAACHTVGKTSKCATSGSASPRIWAVCMETELVGQPVVGHQQQPGCMEFVGMEVRLASNMVVMAAPQLAGRLLGVGLWQSSQPPCRNHNSSFAPCSWSEGGAICPIELCIGCFFSGGKGALGFHLPCH